MDKETKLQILKDLVSINTVDANENEVAEYLASLFDNYDIGYEVIKQFDNRSNLVAEIGHDNDKVIAFEGHEDTVHENNRSEWKHDPFNPVVVDNKIYGRGVTDMKAGLAAMAIALIELKEEKVHLSGRLKFIATISEELTQGGANYLSQEGLIDDVDAMVVGEPTGNEIDGKNHHKLIFGHKGALIYTVKSIGKAAHSSTPELGIDAIENLIQYRLAEQKYFANQNQVDDDLGKIIYTPDVFEGGKQVNSIPDFALQKVMVRTIPQLTNEQIIEDLHKLIDQFNQKDGFNLSLEINFSGNPVKRNLDSKIVEVIQEKATEQFGEPFALDTLSLGTDASQYKTRKPNLDLLVLGPGNQTAHQTDENIDLDSYFSFIDLYKEIAKKYLE